MFNFILGNKGEGVPQFSLLGGGVGIIAVDGISGFVVTEHPESFKSFTDSRVGDGVQQSDKGFHGSFGSVVGAGVLLAHHPIPIVMFNHLEGFLYVGVLCHVSFHFYMQRYDKLV